MRRNMKLILSILLTLASVTSYAESLRLYKFIYNQDNVSENEWVIIAYNMGEALECYKKSYPRNSITKVSKMDDAINGNFTSADGLKYYEIKYLSFIPESIDDGSIEKVHVIAKTAEEALEFYKEGYAGKNNSNEPVSIEVLVDYIHECQRPAKFQTKGR